MTFRIPIEDIRLPHNVTGGINFLLLASLAHLLRATTNDPTPVTVQSLPDTTYRISDGRTRFLAAVIAGRPDVLAQLDESGRAVG